MMISDSMCKRCFSAPARPSNELLRVLDEGQVSLHGVLVAASLLAEFGTRDSVVDAIDCHPNFNVKDPLSFPQLLRGQTCHCD